MAQQRENWLAWVLAVIGITGAGFAARMHHLVWALFWVIAAIWMLFCYWGGSQSRGDEFLWWVLAIGPTVVVGIILRIVEGVVLAIFGGLSSHSGPSTSSAPHDLPRQQ